MTYWVFSTFLFVICQIIRDQNAVQLKSSNGFLQFIELHLIGLEQLFVHNYYNKFKIFLMLFSLIECEIICLMLLKVLILHLYCIAKNLTLAEVNKPYLNANQRLGSLFELTQRKVHDGKS
jgi:hypothetical protein